MPENFNLTEADFLLLTQGSARIQNKIFDKFAQKYMDIATLQLKCSAEDSEEIVSSAFAKLFRRVQTNQITLDNLEGFVYTIVRNECLERLARQQKNIIEVKETLPEPIIEPESTNATLLEKINVAFNRLYAHQQSLLKEVYWEGKSFSEIGKSLGITEKAARQRKFECIKKLRDELMK